MALKYKCSNCQSNITVMYLDVGQSAKCKSCGTVDEVPISAKQVQAESIPLVASATAGSDKSQLAQNLRQFIRTDLAKYAGGTVLLVFLAAVAVFTFEYENFADSVTGHLGRDSTEDVSKFDIFMHAIWWAVVTFTTVGYGDISPVSHFGKVLGILVMLSSFFWAIVLSGVVASFLVAAALKEEDKLDEDKFKGHTIIAGWNPMVEEILKAIQAEEETKPVVIGAAPLIVLINETSREEVLHAIENFDRLDITHLSGRYTQEIVMEKALIAQAGNLVVVPDRSGLAPEDEADENIILLTVFTAKKLAADVVVIAHISDAELKVQLERANCDEIVLTDEHTHEVITNHLTNRGVPRLLDELVTIGGTGHQLKVVTIPPLLAESTHQEVFNYFKEHMNSLLMGYVVRKTGFNLEEAMSESGSPVIREMIMEQLGRLGVKMSSDETLELEINPADDHQVSPKHRCIILMDRENEQARQLV